MTDTFRALCVELLDELIARPLILDRDLIDRARTALASDEPAVPEGREPASVVDEPRDSEIRLPYCQLFGLRSDPAAPEGELTDEELENAARAAEIQNMKYQGGLSASDPNGIARQLQKQRLAGLRAVATLAADRARRPAPAPMNNVPSERDVSEWIDSLPLWHGATRDDLTGIVMRALKHWGRPTALLEQHQQVAPVPVDELMAACRAGVADAAQQMRDGRWW